MRTENRPAPVSQYDALIVDADTGDILTVAELARQLANTDVVVTGGEYHGHHASHLLQARLQQALYRHNPPRQILSMEQFNLNHQDALDAYLAGQTGETEMIEDADAWENYKGSYRPPLVEFAREHQLPVVAANAPPADIVRCVGREGKDYLKRLPDAQRATLPAQAFLDTPPDYRDKFVDAIAGSHGAEQTELAGRLLSTYQPSCCGTTPWPSGY